MRITKRISIISAALAAMTLASCDKATTEPLPTGSKWALVAINGVALPSRPPVFNEQVLADTLDFGMSSTKWRPSPLARAVRVIAQADGTRRTEEWWYTYPTSEPLPSPFAIRLLCADGDANPLGDCIDGNAQATIDGATGDMTIRFNFEGFGVLTYRQVMQPQ